MRFKTGQKVRVRRYDDILSDSDVYGDLKEIHHDHEIFYMTSEMVRMCGKSVTISDDTDYYRLAECNKRMKYTWQEWMLEEDNDMTDTVMNILKGETV